MECNSVILASTPVEKRIMSLQTSYVKGLTVNVTVFGYRALKEVIKVR